MDIFYDVLGKFKDFKSMINIKMQQITPHISVLENIRNSYEKVLTEEQKNSNKNFIEIINRLNDINQEINQKQEIMKQLREMTINFENKFNSKYSEVEIKAISQKAFIRIKEDEYNNYIYEYENKLKEKQEYEDNKAKLQLEISQLKNSINESFFRFIEDVKIKNVDKLRELINNLEEKFRSDNFESVYLDSEYTNSAEYINSIQEYKEIYKKMHAFKFELNNIIQKFMLDSDVEQIIPVLYEIQNKIKENLSQIDKIEINENKINAFESLKEKYELELKSAKEELEDILNMAQKDEELLSMKNEIDEFINKYKIN